MLDGLFIKSNALIKLNNQKFKRYFIQTTDLTHRLSIVLGNRGIGKTTTLAQLTDKNQGSLYLSLDDIEISNDIIEIIKEFVFEIGGAKKSFNQIKDDKNSFVVADNLEIGFGSKIPLLIFGLMY